MNSKSRYLQAVRTGLLADSTGRQERFMFSVIEGRCRQGWAGWVPLVALALLSGCGDSGPVAVQPLSKTAMPSSGDAIVVLFVPGIS